MTGHPWIGTVMIAPSIIILIYNIFKWISTNLLSKCEKSMIVGIPFLSPYLHLKLCKSWFIESESEWRKKYDAIKQEYGNVDPFLKSIPSMFLKYSIFSILLVRDSGGANINEAKSFCTIFSAIFGREECNEKEIGGLRRIDETSCTSKVVEVFGESEYGISNEIIFPVLLITSMLSGIWSVSSYLIKGSFKISSNYKRCNYICHVLKFIYVVAEFYCKLDVCIQVCMLTTTFGHHGLIPFAIIFGFYVFFPAIFTFTSLICDLGWKKFIKILWKNPALVTFSLITDFVVGTSKCCCGSSSRNCDLKINKLRSWVKRIWSLIPMILKYISIHKDFTSFSYRLMADCENNWHPNCHYIYCDYYANVVFIIFSVLSISLFIVQLHCICNCSYGSIPVENTPRNDITARDAYEIVNTGDLNVQLVLKTIPKHGGVQVRVGYK